MKVYKDDPQYEDLQTGFSFFNLTILIVLFILLSGGFFVYNQIYQNHNNTEFTQKVASILFLPAGSVNGSMFSYEKVFAIDELAKKEYSENEHFSHAIDVIVRQKLVEQIAGELSVEIDVDEIEATEDMWSQYNWTQEEYKQYILCPLALVTAVDLAVYSSEVHQSDVLETIEHIFDLLESGISFEDLAVQYSEVASSQFGGDVGYVCIDQLDDEMHGDWLYEIDQISEIIELEDRFILAKNYNLIESDDSCNQIGLQMMVIYKNTLSDILTEYKQEAKVKIYGN